MRRTTNLATHGKYTASIIAAMINYSGFITGDINIPTARSFLKNPIAIAILAPPGKLKIP